MEKFEIYLDGEFVTSSKPLVINNPFDGAEVGTTYFADDQILERAICSAVNAKAAMSELPSWKRYEILKFIAEQLELDKSYFANLLSLESGKPMRYSIGEIERAMQTFVVASEEAKRLPGEVMSLDWTKSGEGKYGVVKYYPVGPVAGISPFNFPMNLAVHKIAPAIAAGCPIVLKPSTSTPLSTLALAKVIHQSGLPKGGFAVLPMDRVTGNKLVTDDRFKLLSFTGSPAVGWNMKRQSGRKKVVLELGGNAGVIITKSANMELAVAKSVIGGFSYSGQVCIHAQRIYVESEIFDEFSRKFVEKVVALKFGSPQDPDTEISSMIDEANALRVEAWVDEAVADGAKILCGGKREGTYYHPTILVETKPSMKVCSLEVFGPVVTLEPFDGFANAINAINDSDFGLQAGVFTNSIEEMDYAHKHLEVGGVIINDVPTFRVDHMPYGGVKDSGLGREGVKYAMLDMLEPRILVR